MPAIPRTAIESVRLYGLGILANFRIWMTNGFEKMIHKRLRMNVPQGALIGAGIDAAIRHAEHYREGSAYFVVPDFYDFNVGTDDLWHEQYLLIITNQLKLPMSDEARLGMRFASAIYGLKAIARMKPDWTATKAKDLLPAKIELANRLLAALRDQTPASSPPCH